MDVEKAPSKDIINLMRKLELDPAGCLERRDLINVLKEGVPEFKMKLQSLSMTACNVEQQPSLSTSSPSPSESLSLSVEDFTNTARHLKESVVSRIRDTDLQTAELHKLKALLQLADLGEDEYSDRGSMIKALNGVADKCDGEFQSGRIKTATARSKSFRRSFVESDSMKNYS